MYSDFAFKKTPQSCPLRKNMDYLNIDSETGKGVIDISKMM